MSLIETINSVRDAVAQIANGNDIIRAHNLPVRVAKKVNTGVADVNIALSKLREKGEISCEWVAGEPFGNVIVNIPIPKKIKNKIEWRNEVNNHSFPGETKKLSSNPIIIPGRSHSEVLNALEGLPKLQDCNMLLREVSSTLFWGGSKVLDDREKMIVELLGVDDSPFPKKPLSLLIHMPKDAEKKVLFIENEVSFLMACKGRIPIEMTEYILIYASGYKSGTPRLRKKGGAMLFYTADSDESQLKKEIFSKWLLGKGDEWETFFWGDLDYSGMDILFRLKNVFSNILAWKPGYDRMLQRLQDNQGHPPEGAKKEGQNDPGETGCKYADAVLLPALRSIKKFVDQESVVLKSVIHK